MPLATAAQIAEMNKLIHEAAIYTNCTKPADGADVVLTAGVPAGGQYAGITSGETKWTYKPTMTGDLINEATGMVAFRKTDEVASVDFMMAVGDYKGIKLAFQDAVSTTTVGSGATPTVNTLSVGGKFEVTPQCVVLVAQVDTFLNMSTTIVCYEWLVVYNAISENGVEHAYKRNQTRMVKVTLKAIADPTRTAGDQLLKYGFQENPVP